MKTLSIFTFLTLLVGLAGCTSDYGLGLGSGSVGRQLTAEETGDGGVSVAEADGSGGGVIVDGDCLGESCDDGASTDVPFEGEQPDLPGTIGGGDDDPGDIDDDDIPNAKDPDDDGDGIPDAQDELPSACTEMVVTSSGVSSARISLNGDEIFSPSDFHNKDVVLHEHVNLAEGSNSLYVRLTGSPGDQLLVQIYNCSVEPAELLYDVTVTREAGPPNEGGGDF